MEGNAMNKLLATVAVISSIGFTLPANAQTEYATVTHVKANYQNISVPNTRQECRTVETPIYGSVQGNGATGGDVLTGMIIGGLLGKGVTGKDNGAAAGAVFGGIIAADQKQKNGQAIVGYRQENRCNNITFYETQERIKNYTIRYEWNGVRSRSVTYNQYNVGDRIPVTISINAN